MPTAAFSHVAALTFSFDAALFHNVHKKYMLNAFFSLWLMLISGSVLSEISVVDDQGQVLILPQPANRVISLAPHVTENLYAIGAGDLLVGAVSYSDYPEAAKYLPRVGDYANLNIERILSLQPDLVVAWIDGSPGSQLERIESLGIPVLRESPDSFAEIASALRRLGAVTGRNEGAEQAATDLEQRIRVLREKHRSQTPLRVFYQLWHQPLITANSSQLIDQIIQLCGGGNIFANRPEVAPRVNVEAVIAADPDLILAGVERHDPHWRDHWQPWSQMKVIRYQLLYGVDADAIHRATMRAVDGAEQVCIQLDEARTILQRVNAEKQKQP